MVFSTSLYAEYVTSAYSGKTIKYLAQEGSIVKKGGVLIKYSPNYQKMKIEREKLNLEIAEANLKDKKTDIKRSKKLHNIKAISLSEHENTIVEHFKCEMEVNKQKLYIKIAENELDSYTILAPFDCKVVKQIVSVESGTKVGHKILEIQPAQ